jgi:hypothetical protein
MGKLWETYEASEGTVFAYDTNLRGLASIIPNRHESAMVPIMDLVEFVEVVYHGSELPTSETKE